MTPYYSDDSVTLYHGDCRGFLAEMEAESVDCVITDPPYSENTHKNVRLNSSDGKGARGNVCVSGLRNDFGAIGADDLGGILGACGRVSRGWVIATLDYHHAFTYEAAAPVGLRLMRIGIWLKTDPMPQISGDRPAVGWEAITYLHRTDRRSKWNGHGKHGNWHGGKEQAGLHPTAKPLSMVANWVRLFTNPGDTILDPFAGSGTTLRAAKDEGRKAIGVELDERYCEVIARRLSQDTLFGGAA